MCKGYLCWLWVVVAVAPLGVAQGGPFDQLLKRIPDEANVLVLIDVETTLASPVAQQEGWGKELEVSYVERPIFLPPESKALVMAAFLRTGHDFSRMWELAAMELDEPLSMRSIARSEGGYVDEINGMAAAWTPSDAYFVSLGERELGVMFPAERQLVSRWADFARENTQAALSKYLSAAVGLANRKVPIVMAIDLKDVVQPHELEARLESSADLKQANVNVKDVVNVLSSIRGAVLRVAVGKDVQGQLRIDFGENVAPIKSIAREMVLDALSNMGANVEDLETWKMEFEDRSILMRGPMSEAGQRRVFSVVEIPSTKFSSLKDQVSEDNEPPSESKIREASLTYFKSTEVLIRDLRRDLRGNKASAAVMERYARKIDRMPILNVDNDLLDYGAQLAEGLRSMALAKREGGIQYGTQTAGMRQSGGSGSNYGYGDYYIGYGSRGDLYEGAKQSAADRAAIKASAMAESNQARVEGFKAIDQQTAAIRRQMTQKYGVEF